ncbi:MAG: LamG domain-containing protein, partial [Phycisphaerae bacterium]|nr:LamG domain-containing protein [Phycisphaerae bacterium]
ATFVKGTYTPNPLTATSLIVGKINWKPNGTPDELFLFNVTDLSTEPAESEAFASITDLDFDQSAFDLIAMYDGTNSITDEIRFGNTFADVMGAPITNTASSPDPPDGSRTPPTGPEGDGCWMLMTFTPGYGATTHTAYFSEDFNDVNDRNPAVSLRSPPYPDAFPTGYFAGYDDETLPDFARVPLERNVIYYWVVDEANDTNDYPGDVWNFTIASEEAWDPTPADGARYVFGEPSVALSWQMGDVNDPEMYMITYDVYWGTDEAAVLAGTSDTMNVDDPTHTIGPLNSDTDYYWKVDTRLMENVSPFPVTIIPGSVWHFETILTVPIVDEDLIGWWKLDGDIVPGIAFDSSGYANHGTLNGDPQWVVGYDGGALEFDGTGDYVNIDGYKGVLGAHAFSVTAWIKTTTNASIVSWGTNANGQRMGFRLDNEVLRFEFGGGNVIANTQVTDGEWHHVAMTVPGNGTLGDVILYVEGVDDMGVANNPANLFNLGSTVDVSIGRRATHNDRYYNGMIDDVRVYNKSLSDKEIKIVAGLLNASDPNPSNGTADVAKTPTLTWTPGVFVAETNGNELYFSSDASAVSGREPGLKLTLTDPTYAPGTLDMGETYYWAVDTVNDPCNWPGDLWKFTTINYLVIDDMNSYVPYDNSAGPHIFVAWRDGKGDCAGSGNETGANLLESTPYLIASSQLMEYDWDNDGLVFNPCTGTQDDPRPFYYSKIEAQVAGLPSGIGSNWTIEGVKALSLLFYGDPANSINDPLWVQLSDGSGPGEKVEYGKYADESLADIQDPGWHEWLIDLNDFDVDLTNVVSISIGVGDENATGPHISSGTLYIDDVRLYTPRCIPSRNSAEFAKVDYAPEGDPDCVVNYKELEIMAENWLGAVPIMVPITVPDAGFDDHVLSWGDYVYISDPAYTGAWKPDVVEGAYVDYGYWDADGDLPALSGNNMIYGGDVPDYIYQILDETFVEGEAYTLSVWVGQPWSGYGRGWWLYFTAEDYTDNLIEASGSAAYSWEQVSLVYTATAAAAGKKIGIKMKGDQYVTFEDVTLFHSSEPLTADPLVNLHEDTKIDFKDFAVLGDSFLDEGMFP